MASVRVSVSIDQGALAGFIAGEVAQALAKGAGRGRDYAKAEITRAGRVDTGQMRNAVVSEVVRVDGNLVVAQIRAEADHSAVQHEGARSPTIVPRRARVLRFKPRGSTAFVFAPSVPAIYPGNVSKAGRSLDPVPFLTLALDRLTPDDFT